MKGEGSGKVFSDISLSDKVCLGLSRCTSNHSVHIILYTTHPRYRSGMSTMTLVVGK